MNKGPIKPDIRLKDDSIVVHPYAVGFVIIGVAALTVIAVASLGGDATILAVVVNAALVILAVTIQNMMILAKAIESANRHLETSEEQAKLVRQTNGHMSLMLKIVREAGVVNGKAQGWDNAMRQVENNQTDDMEPHGGEED